MTSKITNVNKPQFTKYRLGELCTIVSGSTPSTQNDENWNGDNCWVTPAEISDKTFWLEDTVRHLSDVGVKSCGLKPFPKGTVLLSSRAPIGKVAIAGCEMYCNQGFKNLVCSELIHNEYLYFWLKSRNLFLQSLGRGATFKEISKKIVENIEISIPSVDVQIRQANILKKIDEIIGHRKVQLEKLGLLVKSQFMEMFGDPILNPQKWKVQKLNDVCIKINDGTHFSPESFPHGEYKYITAKNIRIWGLDLTKVTYVSEEIHRGIYERCDPKKGDVLYIKDGATTGIAIVNPLDEEFSLLSSVALLRPNTNQLTAIYLRDFLNYPAIYEKIRGSMAGAAITRLTVAKIRQIEIPVPQLDLQKKYVIRREQIDKSKFAVEESIRKLELLKKSLMQQYFG